MRDQDFLERTLYEDEYIIWQGKPNPIRVLENEDLYAVALIIISLTIIGGLIICQINPESVYAPIKASKSTAYTIIFFFSMLYLIAILKQINKINILRKSGYIFTNKRIFIYSSALFNRVNKSKQIYKNSQMYTRYTQAPSISMKMRIIEERSIDKIIDFSIAKNLYGGLDIRFIHSIYAQSIDNIIFKNVQDAELLRDIFYELREKEKYTLLEE